MKTLNFALFLFLFPAFILAQKNVEIKPPSKLQDSLKVIYDKPESLKWFLDQENNYIASFRYNAQNLKVVFSEKGRMKETRTQIPEKELPSKVNVYIIKKYPKDMYNLHKISTCELVEAKGEKFYYVTIKAQEVKEPIELFFKTSGDLMKAVEPATYKSKQVQKKPEDKKAMEENILKDDFNAAEEKEEEADPTEELEKGKKKKKKQEDFLY
jgi:hypothetical protein